MFNLRNWTDKLSQLLKDKFTYSSSWTNPEPPEPIKFNDEIENPAQQVKEYTPTPAQNIPQGGYQQRTPGAYDASQQPVPEIIREYADKQTFPEEYLSYLQESAQTNNVDPNILASLIASESGGVGYSPMGVGADGEIGTAQIIPKWHWKNAGATSEEEYAQSLQDPAYSIDQAAAILSDLLSQYDQNYYSALGAYNVGPSNYNKGSYEPQYPIDTLKRVNKMNDYVNMVPSGYEQYLPEELLNQYLAQAGGY